MLILLFCVNFIVFKLASLRSRRNPSYINNSPTTAVNTNSNLENSVASPPSICPPLQQSYELLAMTCKDRSLEFGSIVKSLQSNVS